VPVKTLPALHLDRFEVNFQIHVKVCRILT